MEAVAARNSWDPGEWVTMITKWTEIFHNSRLNCWRCNGKFSRAGELRKHLQRYDQCLDFVKNLMIVHPAGRGRDT